MDKTLIVHPGTLTVYRYVDHQPNVYLEKWKVVRETPCGWWISLFGEKPVWRSKSGKFVWSTVEGAKASYLARKKRQRQILYSQIDWLDLLIDNLEKGKFEGHHPREAYVPSMPFYQ